MQSQRCEDSRDALTGEHECEENHELIDRVTEDVLAHRSRDQRTRATVGFAFQQILRRHLGRQGQRRQRVHDQIHPQHLHGLGNATKSHIYI
jgi:hypothetical protein